MCVLNSRFIKVNNKAIIFLFPWVEEIYNVIIQNLNITYIIEIMSMFARFNL